MKKYIQTRWRSFGYAFKGLATLVGTQPHARLHLVATALVVGCGIWCGITRQEWVDLVLVMGLVWVAEGMNTALEFLADRVSTEHHPLIGKAKDVAAASVLIAAMTALVVGIFIFGPYLGEKFGIS